MERALDFSHEFVLSGGTVPIDLDKNLVLLLYYRAKDEYILPKGRKNVGESLEAAAIRETLEETGFHCNLIDHDLPTRAPVSNTSTHTEPIAVQQRINDGIRKIIFWYVARVDSTAKQLVGTQEEGEDFEARPPNQFEHLSLLVREEYLNIARAFGFLRYISGGGFVLQASNNIDFDHVKLNTGWNGFGAVKAQVNMHRAAGASENED